MIRASAFWADGNICFQAIQRAARPLGVIAWLQTEKLEFLAAVCTLNANLSVKSGDGAAWLVLKACNAHSCREIHVNACHASLQKVNPAW